ncbi:beta-lactamase family protein [Paenarthrobacter ilicis]|uniref:serine hydrolase domain-containing protein n=1 Tax=Paenarthrobacter ilicis TaxID=43665 RepID=UPI00300838AB
MTLSLNDLKLFTGAPQQNNFPRMAELLETRRMEPSSQPRVWEQGAPLDLPESYHHDGTDRSIEEYLQAAEVGSLLVIHQGRIRYEEYRLTAGPDVPWISMSVAKSVVSALVGIAVEEGFIGSIEQPISDYITVEPGSAYDGTPIRSVLQMSSGARWNEDYSFPDCDPLRIADATSGHHGGHEGIVATMARENPTDTICRYNSCETQALANLIRAATGQHLADYMQSRLMEPLGFTRPGYWIVDPSGVEMGYAGLNLTARDYAAVGELYRNGGQHDGQQIVPAQWVKDSLSASAPHLQPGAVIVGGEPFPWGYGYQWWLMPGDRGDFSANGVYNQYIYVDPGTETTIVMNSATRLYGSTNDPEINKDIETLAMFRAIADKAEQVTCRQAPSGPAQ